ncbi:MAG: DUF1576 domain-containing protein [Niameybacter sp.]|uniref:DUF1576 domain-containing protein n=1 Tax=Niameybacter sp. TaxID=2033640 RepID=UPI002FC696ED
MNTIKITRRKEVSSSTMYNVLYILPLAMLICAFIVASPVELLEGIALIYKANDILLTDYLLIAGVGATLLNAASVIFINLWLLRRLDFKPNGVIIAALFLLAGFSFMGKNLFNIWPFYLGGYLYSKYHQMPYKNVVIINMFSTALSPLVSLIGESMSHNMIYGIIIMAVVGGFIGFIMPTVSSHIVTLHAGYNLYNMGTAAGFVGMIVYSIIDESSIFVESNSSLLTYNDWRLVTFFVLYCIVLIGVGYRINEKTFKGYRRLLGHSGRIVTDMIKQDGFGLSLVNMGILGLLCIGFVLSLDGHFNGPTVAAMFTVIGFGSFGKHPMNVWPIVLGVLLGWQLFGVDAPTSTLIISALFGTTLAPIAGEYGALWGILAGVLHATFIQNVGALHGGIVLYNNGLSGGIIAAVLIPIIDAFKKENKS